MENIANQIFEFIIRALAEHRKNLNGSPESIVRRTSLQAGVADDFKITYKVESLSMSKTGYFLVAETGYKKYMREELPELDLMATEDVENKLIPLLQDKVRDKVISLYDDDPFLNYYFRLVFGIRTKKLFNSYVLLDYVNEQKKEKLLKNVEDYIENKIINGKHPNDHLSIFFLAQHIVSPVLYPVPDADRIRLIFEKVTELNRGNKQEQKGRQNDLVRSLNNWVIKQFFPKYFELKGPDYNFSYTLKEGAKVEEKDQPLIHLVIFTSILILKYEPNYSRDKGIKYLNMLSELGFKQAKEMLKSGSDTFDMADKYYKDASVECLANDVFATFTINIKEESADSYGKALDFICNLQQKGFPKSYRIKLKSKEKNFLPVKKIGKSKTHQFFANALQYPELYDKIATYVSIVTRPEYEFEWYEDVEDELCAKPGTYAVFGLGLSKPKYFPLVEEYMEHVDDEHQSVQNQFTYAFIDKYGVDTTTIPVLTKCFLACQDHKPLKLSSLYETEENLKALLESIGGLEDYYVSNLIFFIWGKTVDFEKSKKKATPQIASLLQQIEEKADMKYLG
ncbi:hypothetical protein D0T84_16585 [Dysgonomonas sp. 521]|uniref:DUF6138 family protein n=1 Tax=Dysgonomonas sp. 521 TaxID=2302932 RepID=UPI0013D25C4B|nr:DUF6138 family protein [Dysgonomonas sp. 521]NDV96519.1 hypothetical protein [Dysgonomonas sp. 521]